jgi:hypothetical protein
MRSFQLRALAAGCALAATAAVRAESVALLPTAQGVRDATATAQVEEAAHRALVGRFELRDATTTRDALRRLRLRAVDAAEPPQLARLAAELDVQWLLSIAVLDVGAGAVPDVALGARLYAVDGALAWTAFVARSGLDDRTVLGLGEITAFDTLAAAAVAELLAPLGGGERLFVAPAAAAAPALGTLAVVPFTATVPEDGVAVAMAASEATRAMLRTRGVALAAPGCVTAALRERGGRHWGELSAWAREELQTRCGATTVVTGSVERWETAARQGEPAPIIAVALRLLDAASGRIVWTGAREVGGADHPGLFGLRRIYSRGALLARAIDRLGADLIAGASGREERR